MNSPNPYAPPRGAVEDVAEASGELAGRGTRLGAAFLDGIIAMVMIYVPMLVGALVGGFSVPTGEGVTEEQVVMDLVFGLGGSLALIGFIVWAVLTWRSVASNGQSLAKRIVGIKVVRTDGSKASLGRIFWLRNVVNGLLSMIPLYQLVDLLLIFGQNRQCIHDKLADTIVVKA